MTLAHHKSCYIRAPNFGHRIEKNPREQTLGFLGNKSTHLLHLRTYYVHDKLLQFTLVKMLKLLHKSVLKVLKTAALLAIIQIIHFYSDLRKCICIRNDKNMNRCALCLPYK